MAGVGGAFATGDLFNLYVWFEVMLIAALGLLVHRGRVAALDGTLRYLVLNMVGTLVLLTGIGGLTSFGQAAFVGLGAYATAVVTTETAEAQALPRETRDERTKARYQPNAPDVQAYYRTNRY